MTKRHLLSVLVSLLLASSVGTIDAAPCQAVSPDLKDQYECEPIPNSDGEVTTGSITGVSVHGIRITAGSSEASPEPFRVYENGESMASATEGPAGTGGNIPAALQADGLTSAMIAYSGLMDVSQDRVQAVTTVPRELPTTPPLPTVPTLPDVQKLVLANAFQKVEIAQLRLTAAVAEAQALVKDAQRPGFTLDLQSLTYAPEKPIAPAPAKE